MKSKNLKSMTPYKKRVLISRRMPSPWKTCQRPGALHYAVFPRSNRSGSTHLHLSDARLLPEGGRTRALLLMWKKKQPESREGVSEGNTRHRGGLLVRTKSCYALNPAQVSQRVSISPIRGSEPNMQGTTVLLHVSVPVSWCLP